MFSATLISATGLIIRLVDFVLVLYLVHLLIKVLKTHIKSPRLSEKKLRKERYHGEMLLKYRTDCKMAQEFAAKSLRLADRPYQNGKTA